MAYKNQTEEKPTAFVIRSISESFGKDSELARIITGNILSILENTNSEAAMLSAAHAICEIKGNLREAEICSIAFKTLAHATRSATDIILAADQLLRNRQNPSPGLMYSVLLRKAS